MNKITIQTKRTGARVDRRLHGHFIEFLGTCISGGIWVGEDSSIPNYHGLRKDVVDALARLQPPVIRWPGGCFADTYHWRDGIGPRAKRPVTYNDNFGTMSLETNQFGTHEFIELCRLTGAKPWININMLSGTVAEMKEWAEYCNRESGTTLAMERAANGSKAPFQVEYWGIGNEAWGGGGRYRAKGYADDYRKYATAFPAFAIKDRHTGTDLPVKLIAVGPDGNKKLERVRWTKDFFHAYGAYRQAPLYGYDLHFYNWNTEDESDKITSFSRSAWYRVLSGALELEEVIAEQYALMKQGIAAIPKLEYYQETIDDCQLVVGEWGNWHKVDAQAPSALWQQATMRDALSTALTLDIFHRNCDKVSMACVAQSVNVLNSLILTFGEQTVLTPNYHVFEMYRVHQDASAVACQVHADPLADQPDSGALPPLSQVHAFASLKADILSVNVVNPAYEESCEVSIAADIPLTFLEGQVLGGLAPEACNTPKAPEALKPRAVTPPLCRDGIWQLQLPKASVSVYRFRLQG